MKQKKVSFRVMSYKCCYRCGKWLKVNVIARKPTVDKCYSCFQADRKNRGGEHYALQMPQGP